MGNQQSGFTLIELIAVIVILGVLAATAVPTFINLTAAAEQASTDGIAGALGSASALNHANNIAKDAGLTITTALTAVAKCSDVEGLIEGTLDADYNVDTVVTVIAEGASLSCNVAYDSDDSGAFNAGDSPTSAFTAFGVTP